MMHDDALKGALARRRGKGFDLTISIQPMDDKKDTDLAPDPEPKHASAAEAAMAHHDMPEPMDPEQDKAMSHEMMGGMSEHDLKDMGSRKPRSLGERVRMSMHGKK